MSSVSSSVPALFYPEPLWEDILPGGHHWSARIRRGTVLQFDAMGNRPNLSALFFNAEEKLERFNMPDTLKAQHTFFLGQGHVCYSDMGRILCSIIDDEAGWNDTVCGVTDADWIRQHYGEKTFSDARNGMYRNGRDGLLVEMGKWGLGLRDLVANVNFFSRVTVQPDGRLAYHPGHAGTGCRIRLRFEMDTLVVLSAAPHPLDHQPGYAPSAIHITAFQATPLTASDPCLNHCPENRRGFMNTARYNGSRMHIAPEIMP